MSERQRHLTDEELVELCLGDGRAGADGDRSPGEAPGAGIGGRRSAHLDACEECAARHRKLRSMLEMLSEAPVPERGDDYGARVWDRIVPEIEAIDAARGRQTDEELEAKPPGPRAEPATDEGPRVDGPRGWTERFSILFRPRRLAWAAAVVVMVVAAFLVGRYGGEPAEPPAASADGVRERILLVALSEHLERTQLVLVELTNADAEDGLDITTEKARASDLVGANRLYRRTASRVGDPTVAGLLEELERILVEVANSPDEIGSEDLEALRRRIESQGILFKVRVVSSRARQGDGGPRRPGAAGTTNMSSGATPSGA